MNEIQELKVLAYDLRKKVVEMIVEGGGGHIAAI